MQSTWIVVADSSRARIFEMQQPKGPLSEIEGFVNPAGRADEEELRTDGGGRFFGKGDSFQGHTAEPRISPKQHENELFAHSISKRLNSGRNEHRYSRLRLIAAPRFLGLIRSKLNAALKKMVEDELPKDLSTATAREIEQYIRKNGRAFRM
ncbi:MAG TPA: host attachment protein [Methylophilaceae bacterium]|nr:host attachment protein [Methylophilaceae bacterium]